MYVESSFPQSCVCAHYSKSDAIASSVVERFNVNKADILGEDPSHSSANPAVKLALAETHVIQETRKFLASEGIHLSAFSLIEKKTGKSPLRCS
jgi:multiple RNA-binding domain-containing protein 1